MLASGVVEHLDVIEHVQPCLFARSVGLAAYPLPLEQIEEAFCYRVVVAVPAPALLVCGADPRRILLMTFSRRAASEMTRRVERIARKVMGDGAGVVVDALSWAGTFHGVGARLLRDLAEQIGLDPAFTIHDREDAADLMNLVRHELGFSKTEARFPTDRRRDLADAGDRDSDPRD